MSPSTKVMSCSIIAIFYIHTFATLRLFSLQLTKYKDIDVNTGLLIFISILWPFILIIIRILAYLLIGTPPEGKSHAAVQYSV